jgi:hypothetical protein
MNTAPLVRLLRGAGAGAAATLPMSAVMLGAGRLGLMGEQPPEAVTQEAAGEAAGTRPHGRASNALASLAHVGFGTGSGAVYALLPRPTGIPAPVTGMAFGLAVWSASYQGWVPRFGALPHPEHDRKDRVAVMILAHLVFGAALGALQQRRNPTPT